MSLLQRYVLTGFLRGYITALLALAGFYILIDALANIDEFARASDVGLVAEYYINMLPVVIYQVSPAACLVAVLVRIGRLARDNEILAMRAAAISPARIVSPVMAAGVVIAVAIGLLGEFVITAAAPRAEDLHRQIRGRRAAQATRKIENLVGEHAGATYYIGELDLEAAIMRSVSLTRPDTGEDIVADWAAWDGKCWVLHDGVRRVYSPDGRDVILEEAFEELEVALDLTPDELALSAREPESLRIGQLRKQIEYVRRQGSEPASAIYEIHMRLAAPLANVVTVLLGLIFALNLHRGGAIAGFGIAVGASIVYYLLVILCQTLHEGRVIWPEVAAWIPNILFGAGTVAGFTLYQRRH